MIIVDINSIYWQCFFPEWQQWETNKPSALDIQQASGKESLLQTKTLSWDLNQQSIKASNSAPGTPQSLGRQTANCLGRQLACVSQRLHTRVENLRLWHVWSCYPTYLEGTFFQNEEVGRTILCVETMMFIMPVVISQGRRRKHASWSQSTPSAGHPKKTTDIPLPNAITPHRPWL